jgi:hypothetical protein
MATRISSSGGSISTVRPQEKRDQPLFHAFYLLGVGVAGHDDLFAAFDQRVEGVEEFFLGAVLAGKNWMSSISSNPASGSSA